MSHESSPPLAKDVKRGSRSAALNNFPLFAFTLTCIVLADQGPSEMPGHENAHPISAWSCQICNQRCALHPPQNWFQIRHHQVQIARGCALARFTVFAANRL